MGNGIDAGCHAVFFLRLNPNLFIDEDCVEAKAELDAAMEALGGQMT